MKAKEITVLLPMKGHSERVPNKNMKLFNGKPLYHAIMSQLQQCDLVSRIVINTDSEIIANNALKYFDKVLIHWRPEEIQGDFISMNDIIDYDINKISDCNHFMQTHSTNPLLSYRTIEIAINKFFIESENCYDSLFSVTKFQSRFYWKDGRAINHNPDELIRTQDLSPIYEENSNLYIFSKDSFKNADNKRIGLNPFLFSMDPLEAIDIDNQEDFVLAETLAKFKDNQYS